MQTRIPSVKTLALVFADKAREARAIMEMSRAQLGTFQVKPSAYVVSVNGNIHTFKSRPAARVYKALQKARGASVWMRAIF